MRLVWIETETETETELFSNKAKNCAKNSFFLSAKNFYLCKNQ